jgi:hypothetical protein
MRVMEVRDSICQPQAPLKTRPALVSPSSLPAPPPALCSPRSRCDPTASPLELPRVLSSALLRHMPACRSLSAAVHRSSCHVGPRGVACQRALSLSARGARSGGGRRERTRASGGSDARGSGRECEGHGCGGRRAGRSQRQHVALSLLLQRSACRAIYLAPTAARGPFLAKVWATRRGKMMEASP